MLGIVATLKVKPGMEQEFEAVARQLVDQVRAHEPGCTLYVLHRAETAGTYVFMERYVDDAAFEAHRKTAHMQTLGRKMGDYMDGRAELMRLREIPA
ncbi:MAG TPA: putative quinol monooxygenase [Methylomirabilota bacterium]|jgi:quinol monooxygenase YgiN